MAPRAGVCDGARGIGSFRTDATQSRALRVEQTRNGDDRVAVVEERQQLDGARESAQKRLGDSSHVVVACLFRGMKLTGC